ncbi:uncharacterized protein LOC129231129 [Uloborus diversus]|uniref:uncharacterized protein LOC129231129 n=1 Tax=Uloborus diversus TaxID=327109 RepID=UPI00240A4C14|nr:uncharacterized protein LOC129231129 [Uloborus diversus]
MESLDTRDLSLKELPTRELKLKRHKVRRDSPTIPPIRLRLKSNVSPLNSETEAEKCFSDRSVSSSPDSVSQEHSPVLASPYKTSTCISSSPSSPLGSERNNNSFNAFRFSPPTPNFEQDYDQPLDMSKKRLQDAQTSNESQSILQQQFRPSVITCASALLRTQCNLTDSAHHVCKANVSDSNSNIDNDTSKADFQNNKVNNEIKSARPGHRREIVSGSCDPVIDEHFRRSLGKDYQQIFSKSAPNSVSITVDDHFAKALGDTWHKLQKSKVIPTDSVSSAHTSKSIQAQKSSQFLHQPPEILS